MGFAWTPGLTLLIVIPSTLAVLYAAYAIRQFVLSKKTLHDLDLERPQVSYVKIDEDLQRSLYSDPTLDHTNPRDAAPSLLLKSSKYATPPVSRPQSLHSGRRSRAQSVTDLADMRQALFDDFDGGDRYSCGTSYSRPSSRHQPPQGRSISRRRSSYGSGDASSRRNSAHSTKRTSVSANPTQYTTSRNQSRERTPSQSPHRQSFHRKSTDMASIHSRRSSLGSAQLRHSLYAEDGPVHVRPDEIGISPFLASSRNSSSSNLPTMTSHVAHSPHYPSDICSVYNSCPDLTRLAGEKTFADLRAMPIGGDFAPAPTSRSSKPRSQQHESWNPDVPPVPPLPLNWMIAQAFPRDMV